MELKKFLKLLLKIPSPKGDENAPLRALIFDSLFDSYRGVIGYVRVLDGEIKSGDKIRFMNTKKISLLKNVAYYT